MNYSEISLKMHEDNRGKISVVSKVAVANKDDLSTAYTPGVAEPCRKISEDKNLVYKYTAKGNLVAVVTDGTAVLGLGDIGPEASMPVMEGKAVLFKEFGNVDAFPICLDTKDVDEIVETVIRMAPTFGGINLEDISAPRCVEIERRLKAELDIPVFHDDQHGTAVVVIAGMINALKLAEKKIEDVKIVINGAGSAGSAIAKMLLALGAKDIKVCDRRGILHPGAPKNDFSKEEIAKLTNPEGIKGSLVDAMKETDVFIGVSAAKVVSEEMIASMNEKPLVFPMANPEPEIMPDLAKKAGAFVVGTGRSDFPNQLNNVLAFPGIFRGTLDVRASDINEEMKIAASIAIASIIDESELTPEYIIPNPFDERIVKRVSKAVADAAIKSGVSRI
ncbi:MAG TPA: malic enzyme-like NAD(P)-binding protein [Clostridia bacterium]|nr:malic enzyme-like NAD(P)-binding protein [Clostridia bacterium]